MDYDLISLYHGISINTYLIIADTAINRLMWTKKYTNTFPSKSIYCVCHQNWSGSLLAMSFNFPRCRGRARWLTSTKVKGCHALSHWGRVTHICVSKLSIIGSDNGLSPDRRQAIIWTNDGILLIGTLGTNFSEISIRIQTFLFKKMHLKMSSGKWRPFCLGLNVLRRGRVLENTRMRPSVICVCCGGIVHTGVCVNILGIMKLETAK